MDIEDIEIQKSWKELDFNRLKGVVMIVGGSNTGKTTFTQFLYSELKKIGRKVAYIDGDPGQSTLGPPTTMTVQASFPINGIEQGNIWQSFVGSISPKGHMLQILVGANNLLDIAKSKGATIILYDTTGLIDPLQGGLALKIAKIDLLHPSTLIAFQRNNELNPLLYPLKQLPDIKVEVYVPSIQVKFRDQYIRQKYRKRKFQEYFADKPEINLNWKNFAVFPAPRFVINRLIGIENREGFLDALGIITAISHDKKLIRVKSPEFSPENIGSLRLGNILVDPKTFEDRYI